MARKPRITFPGAHHHVFNRGVEKRKIFLDQMDYKRFNFLWRELSNKLNIHVHAYCWMPNHYHAYVETPNGNLSQFMQQLEGRYAQWFNMNSNRVGALFQGRYKSPLVLSDTYSLELCRYIHLNPVKAKIVEVPQDYKWSSYRAFQGIDRPEPFHDRKWFLSQFSSKPELQVGLFHKFTMDGLRVDWEPEMRQPKNDIILTSPESKT